MREEDDTDGSRSPRYEPERNGDIGHHMDQTVPLFR